MNNQQFEQIEATVNIDKPLMNMIEEHLDKTGRTFEDLFNAAMVKELNNFKKRTSEV